MAKAAAIGVAGALLLVAGLAIVPEWSAGPSDNQLPLSRSAKPGESDPEARATNLDTVIHLVVGGNSDYTIVYDSSAGEVAGRHVFYNRSAFDGDNAAANADDDGAIAPDKTALLPGHTATYTNYTSYSRGINGVMVDIPSLPGMPTVSDFTFKIGNDNDLDMWTAAPAPESISVRTGAGVDGSDRITIIWADNFIQKRWLQVTVKATAATGLASPDVFYFGSAVGETGDSTADARVTPTDLVGVRNNPHTLSHNPAGIDDAYDFNRDKKVGPTDEIVARNYGTNSTTALKLIVIDAFAVGSVTQQFAAEELAKYVKQISGADIPICTTAPGPKIVVAVAEGGQGPGGITFTTDEAEHDAFVIKAIGQDLYLIGSNKRGVVYAVYTLLEKYLGCRWTTFGEWEQGIEEYVPTTSDITLTAMDDRQQASMKCRGLICAAWFGNTPINIVDWAAKNKLNFFFMQASSYDAADNWRQSIVIEGMIPRGFVLVVGHHSFKYFLDPNVYFAAHPDWYALIDGVRVSTGQFCLTNADAVSTFRANFRTFANKYPEIDIFAPGPNDGYGWCECSNCTANAIPWTERPQYQAVQDLLTGLMNQVDQDVQSIYPNQGKRTGSLAYVNYSQPPASTQPAPGMFISYSFFTRNWYTIPWTDAGGSVPSSPYRFDLNSQNLVNWVNLTGNNGGDVTMYEYYCGRSSWSGVGFYLMDLITVELDYFRRIGVTGAAVQAHWTSRKTVPANLYVFAKSLWNTSLSSDAILAEYAQARFGSAAAPMIDYLKEAERNSREFNRYFVAGKEAQRDASLALCQAYLDQAKALADTPQVTQNIADEEANFVKLRDWQLGL